MVSKIEALTMRLENSPILSSVSRTILGLGLSAFFLAPASAQEFPSMESVAVQGAAGVYSRPASLSDDLAFQRLHQAVLKARSASNPAAVAEVERALESVTGNLGEYPQLSRVHGHEEPMWLTDRGDLTAQAVLALAALERKSSHPNRRETLEQLAMGLTYLQRKDRKEYPFGAHISWKDTTPMARLGDGSQVPAALYRTDRAYAVQALAEAGQLLDSKVMLESAQREALGMASHLVVHGRLIRSFSPQPEMSYDANDALPLIGGFVALYEATGNRIYADLGALATHWTGTSDTLRGPEWSALKAKLEASPAAPLLRAKPVGKPVTFQYIQAEDGKVVNKAIDTLDFQSSSDQEGTLAVMGRENTFWMRFDVPTEDDYLFDLAYVQSDVGGGLVSVMMRIDGDKIFQVPLGDVDGKPILRRKYVDGPRPLRSGPHSFGIRFSGLLMTKPALLDSVVVQPALERRAFKLPDGNTLYLIHNTTDAVARTDREQFGSWPPIEQVVVDGEGQPSKLGSAEDRRRRKTYVTVPPYGVALVKVAPGKSDKE